MTRKPQPLHMPGLCIANIDETLGREERVRARGRRAGEKEVYGMRRSKFLLPTINVTEMTILHQVGQKKNGSHASFVQIAAAAGITAVKTSIAKVDKKVVGRRRVNIASVFS